MKFRLNVSTFLQLLVDAIDCEKHRSASLLKSLAQSIIIKFRYRPLRSRKRLAPLTKRSTCSKSSMEVDLRKSNTVPSIVQ